MFPYSALLDDSGYMFWSVYEAFLEEFHTCSTLRWASDLFHEDDGMI